MESLPTLPTVMGQYRPMTGAQDTEEGWDFFISYTSMDQAWAEWVAWQLEDADYRVLIQAWDFVAGSDWRIKMQQGVSRSQRTIALLSDAYLKSVYGQEEWQVARSADPQGLKRKLIPVRIENCPHPDLLGSVVSIDLFDLPADAARSRLLDAIRGTLSGRARPTTPPDFPVTRRAAPPVSEPAFPDDTRSVPVHTAATPSATAAGAGSPPPEEARGQGQDAGVAERVIRVLVADDHPIVLDDVTNALQSTSMQIVGYARTGRETISAVRQLAPDVVLLDLRLPDMLASEVIQQLRAQQPNLKIIMFTAYSGHAELDAAMAAGSHGIVVKDTERADLVDAIRRLVAGERVIYDGSEGQVELNRNRKLREHGLTRREYEILRHVANGETNPEIAVALGLTRNPVKPDPAVVSAPANAPLNVSASQTPAPADTQGVYDDPDYSAALAAFFADRWEEASTLFSRVLSRHPGSRQVDKWLKRARQRSRLADLDRQACAARDEGRWNDTIDALEKIVATDPDFRDATARLEQARIRGNVADLQAAVRQLAARREWNAVISVAGQLAALDADSADLDGLVTRARVEVAEASLAARYAEGLRHVDRAAWPEAVSVFEGIVQDRPGYRDIEVLLAHARSELSDERKDRAPSAVREPTPATAEATQVGIFDHPAKWGLQGKKQMSAVAFSRDGLLLATGSEDKTAAVWDIVTRERRRTFSHDKWVQAVAISPDGLLLATGSDDGIVRVWSIDGRQDQPLWTFTHQGKVRTVAFSPAEKFLASGGEDRTAKVWGLHDKYTEPLRTFNHQGTVRAVAFSPNGRFLATGGEDRTTKVWNIETEEEPKKFADDKKVIAVAFSANGFLLATYSSSWGGSTARLWYVMSGQLYSTSDRSETYVTAVAVSPDVRLCAVENNAKLTVFDIAARKDRLILIRPNWISGAAFSPDGRYLAVGTWGNRAELWDLKPS